MSETKTPFRVRRGQKSCAVKARDRLPPAAGRGTGDMNSDLQILITGFAFLIAASLAAGAYVHQLLFGG